MQDLATVVDAFTPVKPNTIQLGRITGAEAAFKEFAKEILGLVPTGQPREKILNYLLICKFLTIQEITHSKELRNAPENKTTKATPATQRKNSGEEVGNFET